MADSGCRTEHHRCFKGFGKRIGCGRHLFCLARGIRIENRNLGHHGHQAAVLFGLRGMRPGIIGADNDKSGAGSHVCRTHQRIGRHVQPHLFHADHRTKSGQASGIGDLKSDFFVYRPLCVNGRRRLFLKANHGREYLGGRRPRIRRRHGASVFDKPPRDRLIAQH